MENDYDHEDAEFEQAKEDGYYRPAADSEANEETKRKGNLAIGAIYALIGSIVGLIIVGYLLDRFLETTSPWFVVSGVILGTIIGFYQFIRISGKNN